MSNSTDLYQAARQRVIAKTTYTWVFAALAVIAAVQVVIWYLTTPEGYFWPVWPIIGMLIAALAWGIPLFGRHGGVSEERVQAEVARMRAHQ